MRSAGLLSKTTFDAKNKTHNQQPNNMKKLLFILLAGLLLAACEKEKKDCPGAVERTFDLSGFTKITAAETFSLHVTKGADYSIKAKGCADDMADLALVVKPGNFLEIQYSGYKRGRYKMDFEITVPVLGSLNLAGAATATVNGFGGQSTFLRTVLNGTAQCSIDGLPLRIEAQNTGASILNLSGNADEVSGSFSGTAKLNGYTAVATLTDLHTSGSAKAYTTAGQTLIATATGDSRIYYKGAPANKTIEETGTGKVIHE